MSKKLPRSKDADDVPDVRADEPERAMQQFTDGLRRVLAAPKTTRKATTRRKRKPT